MLTVTNNNDGTITATVAGGGGGTTYTVYRAVFDGTATVRTWTSTAAGVGNFSSTVTITTGHYVFALVSVLAGTTTLEECVYQTCSDAAVEPLYLRILDAVVTKLTALSLTDLPSTKIVRQWIPRHERQQTANALPRVFVAPGGFEQDQSVLIQTDDIVYPVIVAFFSKQDSDSAANMSQSLLWREQSVRAFRNQRLPDVPESYTTRVVYDVTSDFAALSKGVLLSAFMLNVVVREPRGM